MSKQKLKQFLFDVKSNKKPSTIISNTINSEHKPETETEKVYKVIVLLSGYPYGFYDKTQETYEGFAVDVMDKIFKDLKLKTKITWISENDVNFDNAVKDVANGKYDIGVGNFSMTAKRSKLINYTHPIYLTDASLVYREDETNYFSLFKNILKLWIKPFALIFLIVFVVGLLSFYLKGRYSSKNNIFRWHFWGTLAALLGEPGTIIDESDIFNKSSILLGLFTLALTFYIGIYLQAITTKAALKHTTNYDPFNPQYTKGIKQKRILVNKGTNFVDEVVRYGGIPVYKERKQDGVELLIKNQNIDGYLNDTGYIIKEKEDRPDFQVSFSIWPEIETGIGTTAFIVNKNKTNLLREINRVILKLHKKGFIEVQCSNWMDARPNKKLCRL